MFYKEDGDCYFHFKLHARSQYSMKLAYLCRYDQIETAQELLQQSWDPLGLEHRLKPCNDFVEHFYHTDDAEGTPLQIAAMLNKKDFVDLFIEYGANANARHGSWTVLTLALRSENGPNFCAVVDTLLKSGSDLNPTAVCKTPLQAAVERGHSTGTIVSLLAAGAEVNAFGDLQAVVDDIAWRRQEVSTRRDSEDIEHIVIHH